MMGTGPYMFTSWTKGQEIVLDRFDDYWNTDRPLAVRQFVVKIILDEATIVQALDDRRGRRRLRHRALRQERPGARRASTPSASTARRRTRSIT